VDAIAKYAANGNRYDPDDLHDKLIKTVSTVEGIPEPLIRAWPGSGGPLVSIVAAYCSPTKGLVTVNPTFEAHGAPPPIWARRWPWPTRRSARAPT
jgi:histidinol-phosphate aminotransferase